MADIAVLGPIETDIAALALENGEDLVIASDVFLIGYPGEVEDFPAPTITRGLISRVREWEPIGITYFQTDAAIAGGQSGGVLVSDKAEVIGISEFRFTEANFGLVSSAEDLRPRIEGLIAGEDVTGLGDRTLPTEDGLPRDRLTTNNDWDSQGYVVYGEADTDLSIEMSGKTDGGFALYDTFGDTLIDADEDYSGTESGEVSIGYDEPLFIHAFTFEEGVGVYNFTASQDIFPINDADEGLELSIGEKYTGMIDYPNDEDHFSVELAEGEELHIFVDSILVDPVVLIGSVGAYGDQIVIDDDSGGGMFGLSSELTFRAPADDTYYILVYAAQFDEVGGYQITIDTPSAEAPTPQAPVPTETPLPALETEFGAMALYESSFGPFAMRYPAGWEYAFPEDEFAASICDPATALL